MIGFTAPVALSWPSNGVASGWVGFELTADLVFLRNETGVTVPAGFVSDLASVPWYFAWAINPKQYVRSAILHDWLWESRDLRHAALFDAALKSEDCPSLLRRAIIAAVTLKAITIKGLK